METKGKKITLVGRIVAKASDTFREIFGSKPEKECDIDKIIAENTIEEDNEQKENKK